MPFIEVQRRCSICRRNIDLWNAQSRETALLDELLFCPECRQRLIRTLYPEGVNQDDPVL